MILSFRSSGFFSGVALAALLCGCIPLREAERSAPSSVGCARAALGDRLPPGLPDKQKHCRAAALIAARCSVGEAALLGVMKEIRDLLGPGNAEWADLRANQAGIRCARGAGSDEQIGECCDSALTRR